MEHLHILFLFFFAICVAFLWEMECETLGFQLEDGLVNGHGGAQDRALQGCPVTGVSNGVASYQIAFVIAFLF